MSHYTPHLPHEVHAKRKVATWKEEVARCPFCKRCVATYVPSGGDGSARLFNVHKDATGSGAGIRCQGSKTEDPEW